MRYCHLTSTTDQAFKSNEKFVNPIGEIINGEAGYKCTRLFTKEHIALYIEKISDHHCKLKKTDKKHTMDMAFAAKSDDSGKSFLVFVEIKLQIKTPNNLSISELELKSQNSRAHFRCDSLNQHENNLLICSAALFQQTRSFLSRSKSRNISKKWIVYTPDLLHSTFF